MSQNRILEMKNLEIIRRGRTFAQASLIITGLLFGPNVQAEKLRVVQDESAQTITVFREGGTEPILVQVARADHRPYLHPMVAPDGKGILTEYSPGHHLHQTGIYWGFTRINGRDYFHHPAEGYWERDGYRVLSASGEVVEWETVYALNDEAGEPVMFETQHWVMRAEDGRYLLDLTWSGRAVVDLNMAEYQYGGLFIRMPWRKGVSRGRAVNSAGQINNDAEGQRARWVDVGMSIEGRDDWGHIAVLDHPQNRNFPQVWRVDGQMGIGPAPARLGQWSITKNNTAVYRHQLVVYGGELNADQMNQDWKAYSGEAVAAMSREDAALNLLAQTLNQTTDEAVQLRLLQGMRSGLAGRRDVTAPVGWQEAGDKLMQSSSPELRVLAEEVAQIFGDDRAAARAMARLNDRRGPTADRQAALRGLVTQLHPKLGAALEGLLDDEDLQIDVIRAIGTVAHPSATSLLLGRYASLNELSRRAVVETMATRKTTAEALLEAMRQGKIGQSEIPTYTARSLASLLGKSFTAVYGEVGGLSGDKSAQLAKYQKLLTSDRAKRANLFAGREIFERTCGACHVLYGQGGNIGPDLTGSNRADLDYILLNILDPSDDIPGSYKMVTLTLKDGRVLVGTIIAEDNQRLTLNAVGQEQVIATADIASRVVADISMMPEGLLTSLSDTQAIHLIEYLKTTEQVEFTP